MTRRPTLHMIGNAHLDPVWLWPWEEGCAEVRSTFRSALDRMDEDPDFIFTCDAVAYYAWVEELDPALFERIQARVAEGRWELAGGWWVEPDCNLPSGESLVRQGLLGQHYLRSRFGRVATVGMNVDPFGHPAGLPQILVLQGLSRYVFFRPLASEKSLPAPLFRWRSSDGSEVLAYRIPHEYSSPHTLDDIGPHIDDTIAAISGGWSDAMGFYGVGNHGGGPTRANIASIHRRAADPDGPRIEFSSPERFFARIAAEPPPAIPLIEGELQHHAVGCYSAHSGIKALNRRAERALVTAETWAAVTLARFDVPYPLADLTRAWRQLAFNQFHDILAGTAIESAYDTARDQVGEALSIAGRATNRSMQAIARQVDIEPVAGASPLLAFNPLPWPVRTPVEVEFGVFEAEATVVDADGHPIASQLGESEAVAPRRRRMIIDAELPSLGYRLYRIRPQGAEPATPPALGVVVAVEDATIVLDNGILRVAVGIRTGWIVELVHLASATRIHAGLDDSRHAEVVDDPSDTWGHGVAAFDQVVGAFEPVSVSLVESGPVRAVVRVDSRYGASTLREDIVVAAHVPYVEVRTELDWREAHRVLKLRVPTGLDDSRATFETPCGTVVRATDGHEEPGHTWVDLSGRAPDGRVAGVSVITDVKSAFDVLVATIGVTAARSPAHAWHDPERLDPARSHRLQDQGRQRFRLAILPHAGSWRDAMTPRFAQAFNRPPTTLLDSAHPGTLPVSASFGEIGAGAVGIGAFKAAEDGSGDLIVRLVELNGEAGGCELRLPSVTQPLGVEFRPHQVRTFRLSRGGGPIEVDLLEEPLRSPPRCSNAV